jgi:hypothetical protein
MAEEVEWLATHTTYRKGAKWWGRAMPYVKEDGEGKWTVYGDWWTEARLERLSIWQGQAAAAVLRLLDDDAAQEREARVAVVTPRCAQRQPVAPLMRGLAPPAEVMADPVGALLAMRDPKPTDDERQQIVDLVARRIRARNALRAAIVRDERARLDRGGAPLFPGDPEDWDRHQLAHAIGGYGRLLLRLAAARLIPDPGDLVPPGQREDVRMRQAEPAGARA